MTRSKKCTVICNTSWGYEFSPMEFESIRMGLQYAREMECPYRLFVDGKLIRRGWLLND